MSGNRSAHGHQGRAARHAPHPTNMWRIDTDLNAVRGHGTKMSHRNQSVVLIESQHHVVNPANPCRALDDGIKDRLHVRRRAADDAEHLSGCGLMLQSLAQFSVALLDLLRSEEHTSELQSLRHLV